MAQAGKYGYIAPGELREGSEIGQQEPVFIIRAQDALAVQAITAYQFLATSGGADPDFLGNVASVIGEFIAWQKDHRIKIPD